MTDLTEQWKKGELQIGKKYFISFRGSEPFEATFKRYEAMFPYWRFEANGKQFCNENEEECVKVLAPAPSFEEWKAKLEENKRLKHDVGNLGYKIKNQRHEIDNRLKEIEKLKDLLKKCANAIEDSNYWSQCAVLQKILEVLE